MASRARRAKWWGPVRNIGEPSNVVSSQFSPHLTFVHSLLCGPSSGYTCEWWLILRDHLLQSNGSSGSLGLLFLEIRVAVLRTIMPLGTGSRRNSWWFCASHLLASLPIHAVWFGFLYNFRRLSPVRSYPEVAGFLGADDNVDLTDDFG